VKGLQGSFSENASVVVTWAQARDAIRNKEPSVEYWLYVVEHTDGTSPRVYPIPWMRQKTHTRYGFYAKVWASIADEPRNVSLEADNASAEVLDIRNAVRETEHS